MRVAVSTLAQLLIGSVLELDQAGLALTVFLFFLVLFACFHGLFFCSAARFGLSLFTSTARVPAAPANGAARGSSLQRAPRWRLPPVAAVGRVRARDRDGQQVPGFQKRSENHSEQRERETGQRARGGGSGGFLDFWIVGVLECWPERLNSSAAKRRRVREKGC